MKSIRWFSEMNPWLDVVVVVSDDDAQDAYAAVEAACDEFWDEDNQMCYGDLIDLHLEDYGVKPLWMIYHDDGREDDEYEEQWEKMLDGVFSAAPQYDIAIR